MTQSSGSGCAGAKGFGFSIGFGVAIGFGFSIGFGVAIGFGFSIFFLVTIEILFPASIFQLLLREG